MNTTINKTISVGDAGHPFPVMIDVEYEKQSNLIIVTDWVEDKSPYDNPPQLWYDQIKEAVEEFFYEQNENNQVVFRNL